MRPQFPWNRLCLATAMHLCAITLIAQPAQQLTLDTPGPYPGQDSIIAWVVTPSGARMLVMPGGTDGFVIRRYDANGSPIWSKRIAHPAFDWLGNGNLPHMEWILGTPFHSDQNEGLLYAFKGGTLWSGDGMGLDTLMLGTFVFRLDENGAQVFAFQVHNPVIGPAGSFLGIDNLINSKMAVQPDGSFHLINQKVGTFEQVMQIQRYDANGVHQWTRLYYEPGGSITNGPTMDWGQFHTWIPDGLGGLYVANGADQVYMHIGANGTCDWAKRYLLNGGSDVLGDVQGTDPVTHDLLVSTRWNAGITNKTIIRHIALTGTLLAADAYDMSLLDQAAWNGSSIHMRPNGAPVVTTAGVTGYPYRPSAFLLVDPIGNAHTRYLKLPALAQGMYTQQHWSESALVGDVLHLRGHAQRVDSIFGIQTWKPLIASIPLGSVTACLLTDTVVSYNDAMGISSTVADTAWLSVVADSMSIAAGALTFTTLPNIPTSDFCSTILGLTDPRAPATITLLTSLIPVGAPIVLQHTEPGLIAVFDAEGRRVVGGVRTAQETTLEIPTQGWASGMKVVYWRSTDGSAQRTLKVMLE